MLNAVNLTFVAFGRYRRRRRRADHHVLRDDRGGRRSGGRPGARHRALPAPGIAQSRRVHVAEVVTRDTVRRSFALIPLLPFVGFLVNATLGRRLPKAVSGGLASLAMLASFAVSATLVLAARRHGARRARRSSRRSTRWIASGDFTLDVTLLRRPAVGGDDPRHHRHRLADPHLLDRVHARRGRQRVRALLLVPEPVRRVHARAGARLELPGDVRRLGGRRPLLVPADRLLVQEEVGVRRRQEGVRRQPDRRLRVHPRHARAVRAVRHARLPGHRRGGGAAAAGDRRSASLDRDAAALHRRHRQVGADSALHLAARRDGRPDAGVGPDPRGDDGDGRRLHDRAQRGAVQPRARDAA